MHIYERSLYAYMCMCTKYCYISLCDILWYICVTTQFSLWYSAPCLLILHQERWIGREIGKINLLVFLFFWKFLLKLFFGSSLEGALEIVLLNVTVLRFQLCVIHLSNAPCSPLLEDPFNWIHSKHSPIAVSTHL